MLDWENMKYIKIDSNTYKLLRLETENIEEDDKYNYFGIPIKELLPVLKGVDGYKKFSIGFDIIYTILNDFFKNENNNLTDNLVLEAKKCIPIFRYYQFESNIEISKKPVDNIRNILQINSTDYVFNKIIDDMGIGFNTIRK